jgi:hypothetical protein
LASLLWRLRRATTIESGLFKIQAKHLLQFRQRRQAYQHRQDIVDGTWRDVIEIEDGMQQQGNDSTSYIDASSRSSVDTAGQSNDLTRSFIRLTNLPTYPLDRLSRYEATLWRQLRQILGMHSA